MESIYTVYKCKSCKREMILLTEEIDNLIKKGKYLSCSYCSCAILNKIEITDNLLECFRNDERKK